MTQHPHVVARRLHVLVAARHPLERLGIRSLLVKAEAVGEVTDAVTSADVAAVLNRSMPSVAVVDVDPRGEEPTNLIRTIHSRGPTYRIPVLALSETEDQARVKSLIELGVRGYLLKRVVPTELARAVVSIAAGGAVLTPMATRWLIDWMTSRPAPRSVTSRRLPHLTPREHDVLRLVAEGMSNEQIARTLVLGVSTVKSHLYHLMKKLCTSDRAKVVALAYQVGLVQPAAQSGTALSGTPSWAGHGELNGRGR